MNFFTSPGRLAGMHLAGAQTLRDGEIYGPYFSGKQVLWASNANRRFSKSSDATAAETARHTHTPQV